METLDVHVAQEFRRLFRCDRIDIESGPPLEARDLSEFGNDLNVPVIKIAGFFMERGRMENEIERGIRERAVQTPKGFGKNSSEQLELRFLAFFKIGRMSLRQIHISKGKRGANGVTTINSGLSATMRVRSLNSWRMMSQ